ncbi:hypothetical protein [Hydrogenophaga sp.]|uniref:hypothetical protein n=1 Tax=Hydrogenophaga sp. TaxID=1904254 RepID=UPI0025C731C4|nr:hypothetical protein [Hydrogenophaga sp.]
MGLHDILALDAVGLRHVVGDLVGAVDETLLLAARGVDQIKIAPLGLVARLNLAALLFSRVAVVSGCPALSLLPVTRLAIVLIGFGPAGSRADRGWRRHRQGIGGQGLRRLPVWRQCLPFQL